MSVSRKDAEKERPSRPGYYLAGFAKCFKHWRTGKVIVAKDGKVFPIWRKEAPSTAS